MTAELEVEEIDDATNDERADGGAVVWGAACSGGGGACTEGLRMDLVGVALGVTDADVVVTDGDDVTSTWGAEFWRMASNETSAGAER